MRLKWLEWWKAGRSTGSMQHKYLRGQFLQQEINEIRIGMQGFLAVPENQALVQKFRGWDIIARLILELDEMERSAWESCWISS